VKAFPVRPISTTGKPSPVVGWIRCDDAGYANLPGLPAWRAGKRPKGGCPISPLEAGHALSSRLKANLGERYRRISPPWAGWHPAGWD
jgi:hypothetical protein